MSYFSKSKKLPGWMAFSLHKEGICVAHISRPAASRPVVEMAAFFPAEKTSRSEILERIAKEHQASRCNCSTLLNAGEYHFLSVDAPNVPPEELKTAIRWRLKDMLDFHVDDATIDVLDVPVDKNAPVRNRSMYAVAARNQLIQDRQAIFSNAKIPLSVIDIPEMAQRNLSALLETDGRGLAVLSFDNDGGLLTVTYNSELYLSRRIDVPVSQMGQGDTEQENASFDRITLELQRSLDHFDRQYHFITVSKLVLAPIGQATEGLQAYLSRNLYLPIERLDLSSILDISKIKELADAVFQQKYLLTIGAALRHEEKVL